MPDYVMAVDPGGTVGLAWAPVDLLDYKTSSWKRHVGSQQITATADSRYKDRNVAATMAVLGRYRELGCVALVCEKWQHKPGVVLRGDWSSAIVQFSMLQFAFSMKWSLNQFFEQMAAQALGVITPERLEHFGLLVKPKTKNNHQNDARSHLLMFLRRIQQGKVVLRS